jgi:hypothetical protein
VLHWALSRRPETALGEPDEARDLVVDLVPKLFALFSIGLQLFVLSLPPVGGVKASPALPLSDRYRISLESLPIASLFLGRDFEIAEQ